MTSGEAEFSGKYGPWAVVAGASDGVGAAYARAMAERGVNVVLLARRQAMLDEVAASIRADFGVETRAVAVDLAAEDAAAKVIDVTSDLEVGMLMYCAGADPRYEPFLDNPAEFGVSMVQRNCVVPLRLSHHFAGSMVERGKGGIVIVCSAAGLIGMLNMVAYGATKAFDIVMAEGLWAELHDKGVDVLGLVIGATDTPALRRLLVKRGQLKAADGTLPLPGIVTAEDTAAEAIANLANGPTWFVGEEVRTQTSAFYAISRSDAVRLTIEYGGGAMDQIGQDGASA
jgi:short-subunit dehydrogenase